eukprot:m.193539 g.193539  ORF g.193539 m.193539 type:complete len:153 (-) comp14881_c0_seq6:3913-4371(-)
MASGETPISYETASKVVPWYKSCRYALALWAFFGFLNVYALRVNLSVAIVEMSDEFGWSNGKTTIVLSSFFYGYIVTQLPGGWLATRFGAKYVYGFGVLTTTVLTLLTPLAAKKLPLIIALRIVEGLGEVCERGVCSCASETTLSVSAIVPV